MCNSSAPCSVGKLCQYHSDCQSNLCNSGKKCSQISFIQGESFSLGKVQSLPVEKGKGFRIHFKKQNIAKTELWNQK